MGDKNLENWAEDKSWPARVVRARISLLEAAVKAQEKQGAALEKRLDLLLVSRLAQEKAIAKLEQRMVDVLSALIAAGIPVDVR